MNSKHTGRQDLALAYHATEDFANTLKPALHFMTFLCHSLHFLQMDYNAGSQSARPQL